jgi:polyisoprenoid-binding protein YceI
VFNGAGVNMLSKKETVGFQISGVVKRSDFGVTKYVPLVSDDVQLIIAGAFEKK